MFYGAGKGLRRFCILEGIPKIAADPLGKLGRYAPELAEAAGTRIDYKVCDVREIYH